MRKLSLILCATLMLSALAFAESTEITTGDLPVIAEPKFGGVYLEISLEDFGKLGFDFGDSVDVVFSTGFTLEDIPYYNGYYAGTADPMISGYPGYPYADVCYCDGANMWESAGLSEGDTGRITMHEKGKYLATQQAMSLKYSNDRAEFATDEIFANFRAAKGGKMRENWIYRSASPFDDQYNRATYVDALVEGAGIRCILDQADDESELAGYFAEENSISEYVKELYETGCVVPLGLSANFRSEAYQQKLADGLREMTAHEGPYLIHCTEGKDRTGFAFFLLEALCGASYEELVEDYMITYDNYYNLTTETDPEKYDLIRARKADDYACYLSMREAGETLDDADFAAGARNYLMQGGMTEEEIDRLTAVLCGD